MTYNSLCIPVKIEIKTKTTPPVGRYCLQGLCTALKLHKNSYIPTKTSFYLFAAFFAMFEKKNISKLFYT